MHRACSVSANTAAKLDLPTRMGPSTAINLGASKRFAKSELPEKRRKIEDITDLFLPRAAKQPKAFLSECFWLFALGDVT